MIIRTGWGFLVAVIVIGCSLLAEVGVEAAMKNEHYYQDNAWPLCVALLVAAALVRPLARIFNRERSEKELIDPDTGERHVLYSGGGHTFIFIPIEYWASLPAVLAGLVPFTK